MGIKLEKEKHIAKVCLSNTKTKNALGPEDFYQLNSIWDEIDSNKEIRVVIIYSDVEGVFCSGLDSKTALPLWAGINKPETEIEKTFVHNNKFVGRAALKYKDFNKPVIAAIDGYCYTIGFEIVMGCELRIATNDASFRMIETQLGIMPMSGANVLLPHLVGKGRSMEILLTGESFSSEMLNEWGLINRIVAKDKLMEESMKLAHRISCNGPESIQGIIRCGKEIEGKSLHDAMKIEYEIGAPIFLSQNVREGINSLNEKRKPNFENF